jgi:uncharacterized membrane-anchored protein YitT (DUF2179 family)
MFLSGMLFISSVLIISVFATVIVGVSIGIVYKKKGEIEENEE